MGMPLRAGERVRLGDRVRPGDMFLPGEACLAPLPGLRARLPALGFWRLRGGDSRGCRRDSLG